MDVNHFWMTKARLIRRISAVSNAIQTKDNEANHLIIYSLNCIRHGRNETYEPGLTSKTKQKNGKFNQRATIAMIEIAQQNDGKELQRSFLYGILRLRFRLYALVSCEQYILILLLLANIFII